MKCRYGGLIELLKRHIAICYLCPCGSLTMFEDMYNNSTWSTEYCDWCDWYDRCDSLNDLKPSIEKGCFYNYNPDRVIFYCVNAILYDHTRIAFKTCDVVKLIEKLPLDYYNPTVPVPEDLIRIFYNR